MIVDKIISSNTINNEDQLTNKNTPTTSFTEMASNVKKFREAWKTQQIVSFNLSVNEYRHAVMGWCSYLIRPFVEPFSKLKHCDKFKISGEGGYYICRVDEISVFEDIAETVTQDNFRRVFPDASLMTLDRVRYLVSTQVYNNRYRQHIRKHGVPPKIMLIRYSLYNDPKE